MVFISIKKKPWNILSYRYLLPFGGHCLCCCKVSHNENKYQSVLAMTQMFDDTHFIAYISGKDAKDRSKNIESIRHNKRRGYYI